MYFAAYNVFCDAIKTFIEVSDCEQFSIEGVQDTSHLQCKRSSAIKKAGFLSLLDGASTVDKASLLAISAIQAHAWLKNGVVTIPPQRTDHAQLMCCSKTGLILTFVSIQPEGHQSAQLKPFTVSEHDFRECLGAGRAQQAL
ncbi:hypothetical protein EMCRGX_G025417 [Ephydatia muelleri]